MKRWLLLLAVLVAPLLTSQAVPHRGGESYVYLSFYQDSTHLNLQISARDLNRALGLDLPWERDYARPKPPEEAALRAAVAARLDTIRTYAENAFTLRAAGGDPIPRTFTGFSTLGAGDKIGYFVVLKYDLDHTAIPEAMEVGFEALFEVDRSRRNLVIIDQDWRTSTFQEEANEILFLDPGRPIQTLDLSGATLWSGFLGMVRFGIIHILEGLDHILFLLALVLPAVLIREGKRWKPVQNFRTAFWKIVTIVTFFTIAHSVTLALAALKIVSLPSLLVESIIAGSIAVAAIHNLAPRFIRHEATIAFAFGLFHGFGFASLLEPLGLGQEYTALTLLGFNLGVEVGQVFIIALIFPVLYLIRRPSWYRTVVLRYGSVLLILIAAFWFVERAFEVPLTAEVKDLIRPLYYALIGR